MAALLVPGVILAVGAAARLFRQSPPSPAAPASPAATPVAAASSPCTGCHEASQPESGVEALSPVELELLGEANAMRSAVAEHFAAPLPIAPAPERVVEQIPAASGYESTPSAPKPAIRVSIV